MACHSFKMGLLADSVTDGKLGLHKLIVELPTAILVKLMGTNDFRDL